MIESRTTRRFREAFANLPEEIRRQARLAYFLICHAVKTLDQLAKRYKTCGPRSTLGD